MHKPPFRCEPRRWNWDPNLCTFQVSPTQEDSSPLRIFSAIRAFDREQVLELTERQHAHITSEAWFCSQTGWSVSASACLIRLLISFNRCNAEPSFALKKFYFSAFRKSSYA